MEKHGAEQPGCASASLWLWVAERFRHSSLSSGLSLCCPTYEGMGKGDGVTTQSTKPPPLGWELLQYFMQEKHAVWYKAGK